MIGVSMRVTPNLIYSHYVRGLILHRQQNDEITVNHKTYTRHLLRTSFRKDGKVKHRTIANISSCSDEEIQAVKLGLKYKGNLAELASLDKSMKLQQGLRVGARLGSVVPRQAAPHR